jgi:hypothetical protein
MLQLDPGQVLFAVELFVAEARWGAVEGGTKTVQDGQGEAQEGVRLLR